MILGTIHKSLTYRKANNNTFGPTLPHRKEEDLKHMELLSVSSWVPPPKIVECQINFGQCIVFKKIL